MNTDAGRPSKDDDLELAEPEKHHMHGDVK
jgi:hypothetical protein